MSITNDGWIYDDSPKKHDTLKEYVVSIKEKCDSLMVERWKFAVNVRGVDYFEKAWTIDSVKCYPDTTWANKVAVYLTPDELDKLLRMVR
jgi:hypothetical protein